MEWFDRQECLSYNCGPWVLVRNANYAFAILRSCRENNLQK